MSFDVETLNAREAAAFLGTHVETLRKLARRNAIPSFKIGRDWRFRKRALLAWAEQQQEQLYGASVLVVDDEERVCRWMARLVDAAGCRARTATSGQSGLELVSREVPDLILLDLVMPGMTGARFLRELRRQHPSLPVVIVTGYPDSDLMEQASHFPPLMLLAKPVQAPHLERTLRLALSGGIQARR